MEFDFNQFLKPWEREQAFANIPEDHYHDNIVAMSSGRLKHLLSSQAQFEYACTQPRKEPTPALRLGSIIHKAILEGPEFRARYKIMPEFSGKGSKAAKEEWLTANAGAIVITAEEEQQITGMLESVMAHPVSSALLAGCKNRIEISGFFNHLGLRSKMRADIWRVDDVIVDLKTAADASERGFMRAAWDLHYPLQASWYLSGASKLRGKQVHDFVFIAVEKSPPYPVAVYTAGAAFLTAGDRLVALTTNRFHQAMKEGRFRGYSDRATELQIPAWGPRDIEEMEIADQANQTLYA